MNVREMRDAIAGLPDEYEIVGEAGDIDHFELRLGFVQHPTSRLDDGEEYRGVVALSGGQPINLDFNIDDRWETVHSVRGVNL